MDDWCGWVGVVVVSVKMNPRKISFAWEIMANMIKIGGITYDTTSLIRPHLGCDGEVYGRKGNNLKSVGPLTHEYLPTSLSEYFGEELDDFEVNIRCTDGNLYNMVRINKPEKEETPLRVGQPVTYNNASKEAARFRMLSDYMGRLFDQ